MIQKIRLQLVPTDRVNLVAIQGSTNARYACGHKSAQAFIIKVPPRLQETLRAEGKLCTVRETWENVLACHHTRVEDVYELRIGYASNEKCADCVVEELNARTLRCCRCGEEIAPGDPVTLHASSEKDMHAHSSTVVWEIHKRFIGCARKSCTSETSRTRWTGNGFDPSISPATILATAPRFRVNHRRPSTRPR